MTTPGLGCLQGAATMGTATIIKTATSPCTHDNHTGPKQHVMWLRPTLLVGMFYFLFIFFLLTYIYDNLTAWHDTTVLSHYNDTIACHDRGEGLRPGNGPE